MQRNRIISLGISFFLVALSLITIWSYNASAADKSPSLIKPITKEVPSNLINILKGNPSIPDKVNGIYNKLEKKCGTSGSMTLNPTIIMNTTTTLTSNKTYNDCLVIGPNTTLNMNHKTVVVNGDLTIKGVIDVKGGVLKVYGDVMVRGDLIVDGGSVVVYKSPKDKTTGNLEITGNLLMQNKADKITVSNGEFIAAGQETSWLEAGTIDVNGDFLQLGTISDASFAPTDGLQMIIRGTSSTPRVIAFDTPDSSYFSNYSFPAGTIISGLSDLSIRKSLSADFTINAPNSLVYFCGNLNGHKLTANCPDFIATPGANLTLSGGKIYANGSSGIGMECSLYMTNPNDYFLSKHSFLAASSGNLSAGMLEIGGDFYQLGTSHGLEANTFTPQQGFTVKFDGYGAESVFDNPDSSYFTNLQLAPGAWFSGNTYCSIPINLNLKQNMTLDYPNFRFMGNLNGKTLTVNCDFTVGRLGITLNGGKLHAKHDLYGDGCLYMKKDADTVVIDGNFINETNTYYYDTDTCAGSLYLNGDFIANVPASFGDNRPFYATGTLKTYFSGANKKVINASPTECYFADIIIASGTTFTPDSMISMNLWLNKDYTFNVPTLYFAGGLNGHTLTINGDLILGMTFFDNGRINASNNLTATADLYMRNSGDTIYTKGSFKSLGQLTDLLKGTIFIEGNFTRASGAYNASSAHTTVFCGTGRQTIALNSTSASSSSFGRLYVANPQATFDPNTTFYDSIVQTGLDLSSITVDGVALTPVFMPYFQQYTAVLPKGTDTTTIHGTPLYNNATLSIDGVAATSKQCAGIPYGSFKQVKLTVATPGNLLSKTYMVKLEQLNTDLSAISLSTGTLDQPFSPDTLSYTVELPVSTDSVNISPTIAHPDSSFTIQGKTVPMKTITVLPGETKPVTIRVTGQDGKSTKDYTVTLHRAQLLDDIKITGGNLTPDFGFDTDAFTVQLPVEDSTVTITPVKSSGCDSFTIDGQVQDSMDATVDEPGGKKVVTIVAKAADSNTTHTYHVTVQRDSIIKGFGQSSGTLSPDFDPASYTYTLTLPDTTDNVTIAPVKNSGCTETDIKVGDGNYTSVDSVDVTPDVGQTIPVYVRVKAGDSIVQDYTINVVRMAIIKKMTLEDGNFKAIDFDTAFSATDHSYYAVVDALTHGLQLIVTKLGGSVTINGQANTYYSITIKPGEQTDITVVGTDGSASVTYKLHVKMTKPLDNLNVGQLKYGTVSSFDPSYQFVVVRIPSDITSINITAEEDSSCSNLLINGVKHDSATLNPPYDKDWYTPKIYTIDATDRDSGIVSHYELVVYRDAYIYNLYVSAGSLSPDFDASIDTYKVILPQNVTSVTITAENSDMCYNVQPLTLTVPAGGSASGTMNVMTTMDITYQISITAYRIAPVKGITVQGGTLSPAFAVDTKKYTVNVPATTSSVMLTPAKGTSCTTMTINGASAANVTLQPAIGGSATAVIKATAVNGQVFTYQVTVNRAPLITSITALPGTLSPAFNATTLRYTVTIPSTKTSVTIKVLKAATGVKSITINGSSKTSEVFSPPVGGSLTVTIVATAADNKTKVTYTVVVKRSA